MNQPTGLALEVFQQYSLLDCQQCHHSQTFGQMTIKIGDHVLRPSDRVFVIAESRDWFIVLRLTYRTVARYADIESLVLHPLDHTVTEN